ncbi:hypothetical protein [Nannocystis sp.]|uniref:hypothetical protein n=1 Tax=Nannocystis sp. TaxID=1962667 RepID=UPI0025E8AE0A|nr:hypothetical protein [Nannocystis sp.]MBK7823672.1 hypothetical protein [Nannocystis sp.]
MHLRYFTVVTLAAFSGSCAVESIDAIIAEHGVTYCPTTGSGGVGDTSTSTGASTGTSGDVAGDTSSSGDGSVSMGEGETLGSTDVTAASGDLPTYFCGDSVVNEDEECDDGNAQDGDACRNDCTRRWIVFITSEPSKQGKFNGIIGADYECRHRATNMFLPNGERYMAWVSTSVVQPADRMYHARGPYVLVNGQQVAANWDALTSGTLEHPINVTEKSETVNSTVWTGTDITGMRIPNTQHCSDWTYNDSDQTGWAADGTATDAFWTRGAEVMCGASAAIYCFEQP